ncbi:hypothetical protein ASPWEDRAFT_38176 [Aspergillus wentii DTO 134E9]|uniref:Hemerythrin-like domain-containing protein n=1 Tax=Aspergillus wentii DTO 134E9 TaxID=1073089 RepID=A0A1L9RNS0_ASPWE|nr:uncharacterized protein ASPWEDRAFT_38176 [Aspergillus wentii DTO 134E9]OJJ36571.1 hypothetical protein ASPWEDRAFT_38176 [Aspergillus wentii DTO 134E9]
MDGRKAHDNSLLEPNILRGNISHQLRTFSNNIAAPTAHIRILDAIRYDHREIISYYELIVNSTDREEQTRWQNQFTWELARHVVAEELVFYPALEKYLEDGEERAEKSRRQHKEIKEQLKIFQDQSPTDVHFLHTIEGLMENFKHHVNDEETDDIVRLDDVLTQEQSISLTRSLERTKIFVPTRSHPIASSKPPFETVVGLLAAPLDHLADLFRKWPDTGGTQY